MDDRPWRALVDEARAGAAHMALDERLAAEAIPTVRLFPWQGAALSYGWKQPLPVWCARLAASPDGMEIVERPTGGGIAFHGSDLSIAVIVPRAQGGLRRWMAAVCRSAGALCEQYGAPAECLIDEPGSERVTYCLTERSAYAVLVGGRKIAGFAARRYPETWLIQGSLLVNPLPTALIHTVPQGVLASLAERAISLAEHLGKPLSLFTAAHHWAAQCCSINFRGAKIDAM